MSDGVQVPNGPRASTLPLCKVCLGPIVHFGKGDYGHVGAKRDHRGEPFKCEVEVCQRPVQQVLVGEAGDIHVCNEHAALGVTD